MIEKLTKKWRTAAAYQFAAIVGVALSAALIVSACQQSPTSPGAVASATAGPGQPLAAKAQKVDVCHLDDDGNFKLINVNGNALAAHLAHGDGRPGDGTFDAECRVVVIDPGPFNAFASAEASGKTVTLSCAAGVIQVLEGLYGQNCADAGYVPPPPPPVSDLDPDKTAHLAATCDGLTSCNYTVDHTVIGDPFFLCRKDYRATWTCVAP